MEIEQILEPNDKIVWRGKSNRTILLIFLILQLLVAVVLTVGILNIMVGGSLGTMTVNGVEKPVPSWVGWIIIIIIFLTVFILFYSKFVQEYAITAKRAIIRTGIIGADFRTIEYDQMQNALVDVNLMGKIFSVGHVKIDTGDYETVRHSTRIGNKRIGSSYGTRKKFTTFYYIDRAYDVFKYLQSQISNRKESLYAGVAYYKHNPQDIGKYR